MKRRTVDAPSQGDGDVQMTAMRNPDEQMETLERDAGLSPTAQSQAAADAADICIFSASDDVHTSFLPHDQLRSTSVSAFVPAPRAKEEQILKTDPPQVRVSDFVFQNTIF